jgi:murein DD-endopeptidase MepM/ murein hydrolase activator NlpD
VKLLVATCLVVSVAATTPMMAPLRAQAKVSVKTSARALQPGEIVLLTMVTPAPVDNLEVRAFNRTVTPLRTGPNEWQAVVGIDLATTPGRYGISIHMGPLERDRFTHRVTIAPKSFRTRTLKVDPSFVNPPAAAEARIVADAERLRRLWTSSADSPLWSGPFIPPVADPANSAFGTRSIYNGQPRSPHSGADFSSAAGTPVKSPNAGRIVLADDLYFTGNTVVIDHGAGLFSLFAHLRSMSVRESDLVTTGAVIGEVGATGRVTGAHLHWAVRANDARVDPLSLLAVLGESRRAK